MSWAAQLWVAKRCSCNDSCSLEWLLYLWHCGGAELKSPKPAYWIYNWPNSTQMSQMATVEEVEEWMRTCMSSSSTFQPCHIVNRAKLFGSSEYIYQLHTSPNPEIIQSYPILSYYKTYTPPNPLTGEQWLMPANETCFPNSIFIIKVVLLEIWEFLWFIHQPATLGTAMVQGQTITIMGCVLVTHVFENMWNSIFHLTQFHVCMTRKVGCHDG